MNQEKINGFQEDKSDSCFLSAKELRKVSHERRKENVRRHSKTKNSCGSWDLSGGLLGI